MNTGTRMQSLAPRVSVVIPTHDRLELCKECLGSVVGQEGVPFEAILVDDGSTDGTAEHLGKVYAEDDRVRIVVKENGGAASARNRGLDEARGDLLVLLDSDDLLAPGALAARAAYFDTHPDVDLALCDAIYEGGWKRDGSTIFERPGYRVPTSVTALLNGAWVQGSQIALRRQTAGRLRFDETYRVVEDVEFLFRVLLAGHRVAVHDETLVRYRRHGAQAIEDSAAILEGSARVLEQYAEHAAGARLHGFQIARLRAKLLIRKGRYREARPHLARWIRTRPSSRAFRWYLRSFLR